jgi:heat shock protein 1/8
VRNSINDDKVKDKLSADDRSKIEKTVDDTLAWLDSHAAAGEKEEFEEKQKEVEKIIMPLMSKLYGGAGAPGGMPGGMPSGDYDDAGAGGAGPRVEEVD